MGTQRPRRTLALLGWAAVGALVAFGLAAAFTPFLLLVVPAAGLALLLGLRTGLGRSVWAGLAGAAWVPLWLAWSDRGGPGDVCTGSAASSSCSTVGSPWPWLVIGLALLAVGLGVAIRPPARRGAEVSDTTGRRPLGG